MKIILADVSLIETGEVAMRQIGKITSVEEGKVLEYLLEMQDNEGESTTVTKGAGAGSMVGKKA